MDNIQIVKVYKYFKPSLERSRIGINCKNWSTIIRGLEQRNKTFRQINAKNYEIKISVSFAATEVTSKVDL